MLVLVEGRGEERERTRFRERGGVFGSDDDGSSGGDDVGVKM